MTSPLPPPLQPASTAALPGAAVPPEPGGAAVAPPASGPRRRMVAGARRRAAGVVRRGTRRLLAAELSEVHDELGRLRAALAETTRVVDQVRGTAVQAASAVDVAEGARLNNELLKSEVRALEHKLDRLGMAFAPATGLDGVAARFAELREKVNALQRQLRSLNGSPPPQPTDPVPAPGSAPSAGSTLFDYVGFERRFRGDPEEITRTLLERYGDLLRPHQPVVDIGCGRGELLSALAAEGVQGVGVEPDPGMAADARGRGLEVHQLLAGDWLRSVDDGSLGAVISTHVVEHLPLDVLIELLELSVRKLRPGGVFVAETPNPASLIVLGNSYVMDPTHVWPLHPSLLAFLCETAGFRDVQLRFFSPAEAYRLRPIEDGDVPPWAQRLDEDLQRLNDVLFGPQDFAVVAVTPPATGGTG